MTDVLNKDNLMKFIEICLAAKEKAILIPSSTTKVGAVMYDVYGKHYEGYNIQNRTHKSYHAEEIAILNAILQGADMNKMLGMFVTFSSTIDKLTFCCACCRQVIYEFTRNLDFIITEISLDGNIVGSKSLRELYPYPFPR